MTSPRSFALSAMLAIASVSPAPASDLPDGVTRGDVGRVNRLFVEQGHAGLLPKIETRSRSGWICGWLNPPGEDQDIATNVFAANPRDGKLVILLNSDVYGGSPNLIAFDDHCPEMEITID